MFRTLEYLLLTLGVAAMIVASSWVGQQAYSWMPPQATAEAQRVDDLFSFLVAMGAFIFLGVVGMIVFSIIAYRAPKGDYSEGHPARGDAKLEILWTVIPTLLVLWIAAQSYNIYQQLDILGLTPIVHLHMPMEEPADAATKPSVNNDAKPAAAEIEVIAKQWAWSFRYQDRNVTSTELHLPVNQTVRLAMQSKDVLHGFYVPEFRIKQDIVPNRTITFVFTPLRTGKYQLHDSQFSGTYFALMEADVYVESSEAYNQWLTQAAAHEPAIAASTKPPATVNQPETIASNRAVSEHRQPLKTMLHSGWQTVPPA